MSHCVRVLNSKYALNSILRKLLILSPEICCTLSFDSFSFANNHLIWPYTPFLRLQLEKEAICPCCHSEARTAKWPVFQRRSGTPMRFARRFANSSNKSMAILSYAARVLFHTKIQLYSLLILAWSKLVQARFLEQVTRLKCKAAV